MSDDSPKPSRKARAVRRAVVVGIVLAVVCQALPAEHRELCRAIASICTGGFP